MIFNFNFNFSIRQKLILGYAVMVVSVLIISLYSIVQLNQLNKLINTSLSVDSMLLKESENLLNSLLVQVSNERKFIITGEEGFKKLFEENTQEFNTILDRIVAVSDSDQQQSLITTIQNTYRKYVVLVNDGFFMQDSAADTAADNKKQQLVDQISSDLQDLRKISQRSLNSNMETSREIGRRGTQIALVITILTVVCGSVFAFIITQSIYTPLQRLKEITHYISHGDFGKKIYVTTNDEIGDLSESFNIMCDRLRELDQLTSDFISNITHDLKTPLASITEANQLMLEGTAGSVTEKQQYLLNIVKEDAARLIRLIDTIIDLSKMESGLLNYVLNPIDATYPVIEALGAIKLLAKSKKIRLSYGADKNLPAVLVDGEKMTQALINIFSNAIKFTPDEGKISVEIKRSQELPERGIHTAGSAGGSDGAVRISISDTGVGIEQEDIPLIFEKFYRGHTGADQKGDGLGLTIVHHIIKAHGGHVWVESKPGYGSTFNILLPVSPEDGLRT